MKKKLLFIEIKRKNMPQVVPVPVPVPWWWKAYSKAIWDRDYATARKYVKYVKTHPDFLFKDLDLLEGLDLLK